ncbi:uncharacterized protein LOC143040961 isoform X2 [Oratosquilla oratoria]
MTKAFSDIGFVYFKNHGVPKETIDAVNQSADSFFQLPLETKQKVERGVIDAQGYTTVDREKLDPDMNRHELRECYDVKLLDGKFPDKEVPTFKPSVKGLVECCKLLSKRILEAMAIGLNMDRDFFLKTHQDLCTDNNFTCLRVLHYPPIPEKVKEGTIRCGAHTDYGTITLLFQDDMGGLQVKTRAGNWENADPIPGAILVNVGDLLQFWTGDRFIGTVHRVLIPTEEVKKRKSRRSIVFFLHPDDPVLIKPLTGSHCYEPLTAKEHAERRFKETYVN